MFIIAYILVAVLIIFAVPFFHYILIRSSIFLIKRVKLCLDFAVERYLSVLGLLNTKEVIPHKQSIIKPIILNKKYGTDAPFKRPPREDIARPLYKKTSNRKNL